MVRNHNLYELMPKKIPKWIICSPLNYYFPSLIWLCFILNSHYLAFIHHIEFYISFISFNLKIGSLKISWKVSTKTCSLGVVEPRLLCWGIRSEVKHRICWLTYGVSECPFSFPALTLQSTWQTPLGKVIKTSFQRLVTISQGTF